MSLACNPREVVILAYPGVQSLDVTGPLEVFAGAQLLLRPSLRDQDASNGRSHSDPAAPGPKHAAPAPGTRPRGYRVQVLSASGAQLTTTSGLTITPHGSLDEAPAEIDTVIVAGGSGCEQAAEDPVITSWISKMSRQAQRTASVCSGAFLLAAAGLLDGRRATTHWALAEELARRHPKIEVDPLPIFVRDGHIWTSAGVTAGMDLALALVEEDHGHELALTIARHLVLFLRRPGNQSQFSAPLTVAEPHHEPLRDALRFAVEHPAADLSVEAMAARANMSHRHFARSFRAQVGITPARYVERVRLEAARRLLEDSSQPIATVAAACGFGTPETLRRAFLRTLRVGPAEYRRRFHVHAVEQPARAQDGAAA